MLCNLRPPDAKPVIFPNLRQVLSRSTYQLLSYSVFTADTLCYAVTLTFNPETLIVNSDLKHVLCHLWRDENMYQIWE